MFFKIANDSLLNALQQEKNVRNVLEEKLSLNAEEVRTTVFSINIHHLLFIVIFL